MAWVRLDDTFHDDERMLELSAENPIALLVLALSWANSHLTDGWVSAAFLRSRAGRKTSSIMADLARVGLASAAERDGRAGWQLAADLVGLQPSRATVEADRARARGRQQRHRAGRAEPVVTEASQRDTAVTTTNVTAASQRPVPARPDPTENKNGDHGERAPTRELLTLFDSLHQTRIGSKAAIAGAKDSAILAALCRTHGSETVERLVVAFFASHDPFIVSAGFTVGVFKSQVGKLLAQTAPRERAGRRTVPADVRQLCDAAGLKHGDIAEWFTGASLAGSNGRVTLIVPDDDARAWVQRHYADALEQAAVFRGAGSLVVTGVAS